MTNFGIGGNTPGTGFVNGLFFGTVETTQPSATVDLVHIGGKDIAAGQRCLSVYQEYAPYAGIGVASTHKIPMYYNGAAYYLLATTVQ